MIKRPKLITVKEEHFRSGRKKRVSFHLQCAVTEARMQSMASSLCVHLLLSMYLRKQSFLWIIIHKIARNDKST